MYLRICMTTNFYQLHFRGRSTLHKIGEGYLSDHGRQAQFGQKAILARSKAKIRNWRIINCFSIYIYVPNPFHWQQMREDYFRSRLLSVLLLARLPLGGENCTCANQLRAVGVMWARHWLSSDDISSHEKRRKNFNYEFTFSFAPSRSSREGRPDRREEVWPKAKAGKLWHLPWRYAKLLRLG